MLAMDGNQADSARVAFGHDGWKVASYKQEADAARAAMPGLAVFRGRAGVAPWTQLSRHAGRESRRSRETLHGDRPEQGERED